jgi:uncharacterized protein (TIGR02145 family)
MSKVLRELRRALLCALLGLGGGGLGGWAQSPCGFNPDANGDFTIGSADLLSLLSMWSDVDIDQDCIWDSADPCVCPVQGCTDPAAINFDADALQDDGSCMYAPAACGGLVTAVVDGHTYALVGIGGQCWFGENLRADTYLNGDSIPGGLSTAAWTTTTQGAFALPNGGVGAPAAYGFLYNWHAVNDSRGLCTTGFHVATDSDWTTLEAALGATVDPGMALKAAATDTPPWDGTNASGFAALPAGYREYAGGAYANFSNYGFWWTSTASGSGAWGRTLLSGQTGVFRGANNVRNGYAVRCVKD